MSTMAGEDSKPAIPAWQRTQQTPTEASTAPSARAPGPEESTPADTVSPEPDATPGVEERTPASTQRDQVTKFLEDPSVQHASAGKKREFLESKGVSNDLIDEVIGPASAFDTASFAAFRDDIQPKSRPAPQQSQGTAPPIITYPEFLVEAHRPPPIITPSRVLDTAYIAGGLAALIYGASNLVVQPMIASLTEARHDFAGHSQSKLDEFNERLGKIVSKIPEPRVKTDTAADDEDGASVDSDPTELFHRDMGTQTSPELSRQPSDDSATQPPATTVDKHEDRLRILNSHLSEILSGTQSSGEATKGAQDTVNGLRHYLDTLLYASPGISVWSTGDDGLSKKANPGKEDAIEELKKEIRGVKGVLLSAKRFPATVGRVGA